MDNHYAAYSNRAAIGDKASDEAGRPDLGMIVYFAAALDVVIIVLTAEACSLIYSQLYEFERADILSKHLGAGILLAATFVTLFASKGAYRPNELMRVHKQILRIALYGLISLGFLALLSFLFKIGDQFSRGTTLLFVVVCPLFIVLSRVFWAQWIPKATARGVLRARRIVLICAADYPSARLREQIADSGVILTNVLTLPKNQSVGQWMEVINTRIARSADEVLVAWESADLSSIRDLLGELRMMPMPVKVALDPMIADMIRHPATRIGRLAAVEVQHAPLSATEHVLKRSFDVVFAVCALVTLFPIFIITAIAIKLDSAGPVFFIQRRRGCNDATFGIIKFRSMTVLEDGETVVQATRNDARLTRVGAFIRSTSIDEIPQLWNVLLGQMSVVGPRPHAVVHDDSYDALIARYAFRRNVKPGITGWAQINGFRGETPTIDIMKARVEHDLWYIHNWSLWLDIKIVALTLVALADRSRAY